MRAVLNRKLIVYTGWLLSYRKYHERGRETWLLFTEPFGIICSQHIASTPLFIFLNMLNNITSTPSICRHKYYKFTFAKDAANTDERVCPRHLFPKFQSLPIEIFNIEDGVCECLQLGRSFFFFLQKLCAQKVKKHREKATFCLCVDRASDKSSCSCRDADSRTESCPRIVQ